MLQFRSRRIELHLRNVPIGLVSPSPIAPFVGVETCGAGRHIMRDETNTEGRQRSRSRTIRGSAL